MPNIKKPKKRKNRKVKITKNSTYYRWIEDVRANVKIYPCEHGKVGYRTLQKLLDRTWEELKKVDEENKELREQNTQLTLNVEELKERLFGKFTMKLKNFALRPDKKKDN